MIQILANRSNKVLPMLASSKNKTFVVVDNDEGPNYFRAFHGQDDKVP